MYLVDYNIFNEFIKNKGIAIAHKIELFRNEH